MHGGVRILDFARRCIERDVAARREVRLHSLDEADCRRLVRARLRDIGRLDAACRERRFEVEISGFHLGAVVSCPIRIRLSSGAQTEQQDRPMEEGFDLRAPARSARRSNAGCRPSIAWDWKTPQIEIRSAAAHRRINGAARDHGRGTLKCAKPNPGDDRNRTMEPTLTPEWALELSN